MEVRRTLDNGLKASIGELDDDGAEQEEINQSPDVEGVCCRGEVGCLGWGGGAEDRVHVTGKEEAVGED